MMILEDWNLTHSEPQSGELEWTNNHNGKRLTVIKTAELEAADIDEDWVVTGENSIVKPARSFNEARQYARNYMQKTRRPSPML